MIKQIDDYQNPSKRQDTNTQRQKITAAILLPIHCFQPDFPEAPIAEGKYRNGRKCNTPNLIDCFQPISHQSKTNPQNNDDNGCTPYNRCLPKHFAIPRQPRLFPILVAPEFFQFLPVFRKTGILYPQWRRIKCQNPHPQNSSYQSWQHIPDEQIEPRQCTQNTKKRN